MADTLLEIFKLGFVGLVAGLFSSFVATRDHRRRKWWEMRVQAYQSAIEALSDLSYCIGELFEAEIHHSTLSDELEKRIQTMSAENYQKVRKFADSGAFLFSAEANAVLREYIHNDLDDLEYCRLDDLSYNYNKALTCLKELVRLSTIDLQLNPSWLERISS